MGVKAPKVIIPRWITFERFLPYARQTLRRGLTLLRKGRWHSGKIGWIFSKREAITALELDGICLKIGQLTSTGQGPQMAKLRIEEIASAEEIPRAIRRLFREMRLNEDHLVASIPRRSTTIRYLLLPSTQESEIEEMVHFQAIKQVPLDREEVVVDHQIVDVTDDGYSLVMLVIAHRKEVDRYLDILQKAGMQPQYLRLDAEAVFEAYRFLRENDPTPEKEPVALIDVDFSTTHIQVIHENRVLYTRSIPWGTWHLREGEREKFPHRWSRKLMEELDRSLSAYDRDKRGPAIAGFVLTGAVGEVSGLEKQLHRWRGLPVAVLHPLAGFDGGNTSLSVLWGLALGDPNRMIDLLPSSIRARRAARYKRRELLKSTILSIFFILLLGAAFHRQTIKRERLLSSLSQRIEATQTLASRVEAMRERIDLVRGQLEGEETVLDAVRELYRILPQSMFLRSFLYDNRLITLKGTAEAMSDVFDLVPQLEQSPIFSNVVVKYVSKRPSGNQELTDFQIQLSTTGEERP